MSEIKYRLAKPSDAGQIANVHYHIRDKYDIGFFAQVNYAFLKQYYCVILNDPNEIIVCAEDDNGEIVGFCSGSIDSKSQFERLRKQKLRFFFPLLTSAFAKPKLIKSAIDRFKSTKGESENEYVANEGAREEYWGWLPNRDDTIKSVVLQEIFYRILKSLGIDEMLLEVDQVNDRILQLHKKNGAEEVTTYKMSDGRTRVALKYSLKNYRFKFVK